MIISHPLAATASKASLQDHLWFQTLKQKAIACFDSEVLTLLPTDRAN